MLLSEIELIKSDVHSPVQITDVFELEEFIVINNYVCLKVDRVSNSYEKDNPIPISLNGIVNGYLIFTKERESIEISLMSEFEFISFLTVSNYSDYSQQSYKFEADFLLIEANFFLDYISFYQKTSMLWGGFVHKLSSDSPSSRYRINLNSIEIGNKLKELDSYSYESCVRAIEQPYAFERFLKLYHLLELQFDYFVINKIKNLTIPHDSNNIGKILNEYSNKEIERLSDLIETNCIDINSLGQKLSLVSSFQQIAEDIFIHFGKSNSPNHLTTDINKFRSVVNSGNFTEENLRLLKVTSDYPKFICKLTAYWIYRIRCSIAHNKIGEYLLSWNDENFIVEFGEPLLKEVLIQYFKE
ncbi:hypothetical protein [Arcicella rosea]|uniref:Uncharacterized protein n=1 Tax=Arcicella rosea TaxID=502909 RepID=A0A841EPI2_9BACT|nr:hypothetical protein [Arcicella rosea]MBB6004826.1 hypothetical protein [Arcicella rosea]